MENAFLSETGVVSALKFPNDPVPPERGRIDAR
jgi:hypothetical protein